MLFFIAERLLVYRLLGFGVWNLKFAVGFNVIAVTVTSMALVGSSLAVDMDTPPLFCY